MYDVLRVLSYKDLRIFLLTVIAEWVQWIAWQGSPQTPHGAARAGRASRESEGMDNFKIMVLTTNATRKLVAIVAPAAGDESDYACKARKLRAELATAFDDELARIERKRGWQGLALALRVVEHEQQLFFRRDQREGFAGPDGPLRLIYARLDRLAAEGRAPGADEMG